MSCFVLIGVDDTDMPGSRGTGWIARGLASHLERAGLGESCGVSRHQLLVHPAIPYTSHNSALCVALTSSASLAALAEACSHYLLGRFVPGSDPGLCVAEAASVPGEVLRFGVDAKRRVLSVEEALAFGQGGWLELRSVAGGPQGVIGALAAVGLRATGNDGRFVELRGIREVQGRLSIGELLQRTAIQAIVDGAGAPLGPDEIVDTLDWVRPSLAGGQPLLRVERWPSAPDVWVPRERKSEHHDPAR